MRNGDLEYEILKTEAQDLMEYQLYNAENAKHYLKKKNMKCHRCGEKFEFKTKFLREKYSKGMTKNDI